MGFTINFDSRTIPPASVDGGAEQLPASDGAGHRVIIIGDESVNTKANDGSSMLVFKLQIIEGPYNGMKGDYRLNIGHVKQEPRDIAYRQLSAVCHAIGVFAVGNTQELYNKPFRVIVEQQAAPNDKYTQIKGVLTDQGIDPGNPNAGPRQASPAPAATQQQPPQQQQPAPFQQPAPVQTFQPPQQQPPAQTFQPQQQQPAPAFTPQPAADAKAPWQR